MCIYVVGICWCIMWFLSKSFIKLAIMIWPGPDHRIGKCLGPGFLKSPNKLSILKRFVNKIVYTFLLENCIYNNKQIIKSIAFYMVNVERWTAIGIRCAPLWNYVELFWNSLDNAPTSIVFYLEMKVEVEIGVHSIRSRFTPRLM